MICLNLFPGSSLLSNSFFIVSLEDCQILCHYCRRFTPEQRKDAAWIFAKSHESYATNYDIVFPHDEHLAGRNFRQGPFHQVCATHLVQCTANIAIIVT
jgi:hypothetical protein